jgi:hypothetical protein
MFIARNDIFISTNSVEAKHETFRSYGASKSMDYQSYQHSASNEAETRLISVAYKSTPPAR